MEFGIILEDTLSMRVKKVMKETEAWRINRLEDGKLYKSVVIKSNV